VPGFYSWQGEDLLLRVSLQPRASHDAIVGPHGDALKIRITAPPVEGKANRHLQKFLAAWFGVPASRVELEKGHGNRAKLWRIHRPRHLPALIHPPD
jgi:uncharacterized protein (TIGR00251 family)